MTAGGDTGRHLEAIVAPLLVHDLPVTVWWPGDPPFGTDAGERRSSGRPTGSSSTAPAGAATGWTGCGALAALARPALPISDFALMRQARWREAVASVFDRAGVPALPPVAPPDRGHLRHARRPGHGGRHQPREADLPRRLAGVPPGAAGRDAAGRAGRPGPPRRRRRRPGARRPGARPRGRSWRGSAARTSRSCSGRSSRRCRAARPCASSCSPSGAARSSGPR